LWVYRDKKDLNAGARLQKTHTQIDLPGSRATPKRPMANEVELISIIAQSPSTM